MATVMGSNGQGVRTWCPRQVGRLRPGREESMKAKTSPRFEELHQELIKPRESPGRAHGRDRWRDSGGGWRLGLEGHHESTEKRLKKKSHCPVGVAFLCKNNVFKSASSALITKGNVMQGFPLLSRELLDRVAFLLAWQAVSPSSSSFRSKKVFRKAAFIQYIFCIYLSWCSFFNLMALQKYPSPLKGPLGLSHCVTWAPGLSMWWAAESCKCVSESHYYWNKFSTCAEVPHGSLVPETEIFTMTGIPRHCCPCTLRARSTAGARTWHLRSLYHNLLAAAERRPGVTPWASLQPSLGTPRKRRETICCYLLTAPLCTLNHSTADTVSKVAQAETRALSCPGLKESSVQNCCLDSSVFLNRTSCTACPVSVADC